MNCLTKILFGALVVVSLVMVALQHFAGRWYLQIFRFLLLFSHIVPIRSDLTLFLNGICSATLYLHVRNEKLRASLFYLMQFACKSGYGKDGFQLDD